MTLELSPNERRVLGVLLEKGFITPQQYPLTLNALVTGCNQKSCRNPLTSLDDNAILDTLDELRGKGLVSLVQTAGGRTDRWRHRIRDVIELSTPDAAVLTELLLRGPQTDGELRQNAKRMATIESLGALQTVLEGLMSREEALVVRLGPPQRRRGVRYAHVLYPTAELELLKAREEEEEPAGETSTRREPAAAPSDALVEELALLRAEIEELKDANRGLSERVERLESHLP